jgi:SPP1 family predicted phage head-tail adaptor
VAVKAGKLKHKVELQTLTETADDQGGFTESWATASKPWVSIEPLDSREEFFAGQVRAGVTHRVKMRYTTDATTKSRILFGSRVLDIKSLKNTDEGDRELVLLCAEVQG